MSFIVKLFPWGFESSFQEVTEIKACLGNINSTKKSLKTLEVKLKGMIGSTSSMINSLGKVGTSFAGVVESVTVHSNDANLGSFIYKKAEGSKDSCEAARIFALTTTEMRTGTTFHEYEKAIYEHFITKLHLLNDELNILLDMGKKLLRVLVTYYNKKEIVEKKEQRYTKEQKSLETSKNYLSQVEERKKSFELSRSRTMEFKSMYAAVMARVEEYESNFIYEFVGKTCEFFQHVHGSLARVISTTAQRQIKTTCNESLSSSSSSREYLSTTSYQLETFGAVDVKNNALLSCRTQSQPLIVSSHTEACRPSFPTGAAAHIGVALAPKEDWADVVKPEQ